MSGFDLARYPNLWKRGDRYYLRIRVPKDVKALDEREHVARSLGTSDYAEAVRRLPHVQASVAREFDALRAQIAGMSATEAALRSGQLEALSEAQLEGLVRYWFAGRGRLRQPQVAEGEEREALVILEQDRELLDAANPAIAQAALTATDRLLVEAGVPSKGRRIGKATVAALPLIDRTTPQYRFLMGLVDRCLRAENASARAYLLGQQPTDEPLLGEACPPLPVAASVRSLATVSHLIAAYRQDREVRFGRESTDRKYGHVFKALEEALGPTKPIREIRREDCRAVRDFLRLVPANASKKFPKASLAEAIAAAERKDIPRLAPGTVASYMNNLSAILNWAVDEEWLEKNPAKGLGEKGAPKVRRRGFTTAELKVVFGALEGFRLSQPERFWVPAVALFTGARAGEICQLFCHDIVVEQGVHCIDLSEFDIHGRRVEQKRLKTSASERLVPLHPQLVSAGFLEFVRRCHEAGHERLFPALQPGPKDSYSHSFSKWFGRFMDGIGLSQPSLVLHSFRHGFRDACRSANIAEETARALGGWAATNQAARYGDRGMVPVLNKAVRRLRFGDFQLASTVAPASDAEEAS